MASKPQPNLSIQLRRAPTRYEPTQRIAVGGMAEVWRANALFDDGGEHPVAIKRVLPSIADPLFRTMFLDEARLGMLLRHPNIVRVYDARDIDGTYIMVMELVDGESLRSLTRAAHRDKCSMGVPLAVHIIQEVAKALAYAHRARDCERPWPRDRAPGRVAAERAPRRQRDGQAHRLRAGGCDGPRACSRR